MIQPGVKIGKLTVHELSHSNNGRWWLCKCDCGGDAVRKGTDLSRALRLEAISSCGCVEPRTTHGLSKSRLGRIYYKMIHRCHTPTDASFYKYGAKGITVCDEWRSSIEAFISWALANGYKDDLSIDRVKWWEGYSPDNCRWATDVEQVRNRSITRTLTWNGQTKTVREWADELGLSYDALQLRFSRGWDAERIFTQPLRGPR